MVKERESRGISIRQQTLTSLLWNSKAGDNLRQHKGWRREKRSKNETTQKIEKGREVYSLRVGSASPPIGRATSSAQKTGLAGITTSDDTK